jgi:hypothetical protein
VCEDPAPGDTHIRKLPSHRPNYQFDPTKEQIPPYEDTRTREIVMSKSSYLVGHPIYLPKRRNGYYHGSTLDPVRDQRPKSRHLIGHISILIRRKGRILPHDHTRTHERPSFKCCHLTGHTTISTLSILAIPSPRVTITDEMLECVKIAKSQWR